MNINNLVQSLAEEIASDIYLKNWAQSNYGRDHKVFWGIDERQPPDENDCPYVAIYAVGKSAGHGRAQKEHLIGLECWVFDDSVGQHQQITNLTIYNAPKAAESMRQLVVNVLATHDLGNALLDAIDDSHEPIEAYPFVGIGSVITIIEPVTLGSNYME